MKPAEFHLVTFSHAEIPMFFGHETPAGTVNRLASGKFGLVSDDFSPDFPARCSGNGPSGYLFEVSLRAETAQRLLREGHPDLVSVVDPSAGRESGPTGDKKLPSYKKPKGPQV
jgi:hypothetical protein